MANIYQALTMCVFFTCCWNTQSLNLSGVNNKGLFLDHYSHRLLQGQVALGSSCFLTFPSWSLSFSASLTGVREAWMVHGGLRAKAGVSQPPGYIPLPGIQSHVSLFELGREVKLHAWEENKPIWWPHDIVSATVLLCTLLILKKSSKWFYYIYFSK